MVFQIGLSEGEKVPRKSFLHYIEHFSIVRGRSLPFTSHINSQPPKKTSTVQHLQFDGWNDPNLSPDPKEILQLVSAIEKSQQKTGNGVIVLQCRYANTCTLKHNN